MTTNNDRAEEARTAVWLHADDNTETITESITDLLANIRHLCDLEKLAFHELDQLAYRHYLAELGEERQPLPPTVQAVVGAFDLLEKAMRPKDTK